MGWEFYKKTIKDIELGSGSRVIVRADFNVPLDENGSVASDYRLERSLDTLNYLAEKGCKTVLISHLGRPDGKVDPQFSLAPVATWLSDNLNWPVKFVDESIGEKATRAVNEVEPGTFLLLENIRFNPGEETNDTEIAKTLASYGEVFVNDCFGVAHRSHSSIVGITKYLPSVAGLLIEQEVTAINQAISDPARPLLAVIGGAKISDKLPIIIKMFKIADMVAVGGAVANTLLYASGTKVADSLIDKDSVDTAKEILEMVEDKRKRDGFIFYLPEDGVVSDKSDGTSKVRIVDWGSQLMADLLAYPNKPRHESYELSDKDKILDVGPASASVIAGMAMSAKTVIWAGALGMTETRHKMSTVGPFEHGSHRLLSVLDKSVASKNQLSIVGGGDTAGYVLGAKGIRELPDLVSTGGSASLELISGEKLPGIEALEDR